MKVIASINNSLRLMRANKMRTSLTLLGLVIGIMTVIIVYSAGEGIRSLILGQLDSFGTNIVQTEIKVPNNKTGNASDSESANQLASGVQITTLTIEDMEAVSRLPNVVSGYGAVLSQEQASYGSELRRAYIFGVSAPYISIDSGTTISEGRFFTDAEDNGAASVAVLGSGIKEKLFGDSDALGKTVKLRNERFTVIGVVAERGTVMFLNFDDYIYIPVQTLQKKLMGSQHISYMIHQLEDIDSAENTAEDIRYTLRQRHSISDPAKDDFRVSTMQEAMDTLNTITDALTFLLLAIVAISLIVGGVGIMNIMYVAVTERTMEIGLRKALGATEADIMRQFLVEAILITLLGGIVGSLLGSLIAYFISVIASALGFSWDFSIPLQAFIVSIVFSAACGIVFGVTPARTAAKLDPIEALRTE